MKEIKLNTQRPEYPNYMKYSSMIDDEDYESVSKYNWSVSKMGKRLYTYCKIDGKHISMHKFIMGDTGGLIVDHIDHNGLNNQRLNLRVCTNTENTRNGRSHGKSEYLGVCHTVRQTKHSGIRERWTAQITVDRRHINIGTFKTETEAAIAYNNMATIHFGEFANLNIINI